MSLPASHVLQSGTFHNTLRLWQQPNLQIQAHNLMGPIFIVDDDDAVQPIASMPKVSRHGVNTLVELLEPQVRNGLKSVLLFGIIDKLTKDATGSNADSPLNPVMRAVPLLRRWFPDLVIACDVCLCPYTNHGHCGILQQDGSIDMALSQQRIAEIALAYARAGAHIVAPSDMADGRIHFIKQLLEKNNLLNKVSVLSYSCKFASTMYGPFREAAKAAPAFGDRKCYQLPPGSSGLAARAADRDVSEGADMLMVKPGLPYLDIVRQTKDRHPHHPLFVYQVSGEYSMLMQQASCSALEAMLNEVLISFRRAGADCIITYFTPMILESLTRERDSTC